MKHVGPVVTMLMFLCLGAAGGESVAYHVDFADMKVGRVTDELHLVDDAAAPHGKAMRIDYRQGGVPGPIGHTRAPLRGLAGEVRVLILARGEGFSGLRRQLRLIANFRHEGSGMTHAFPTLLQGVRHPENGYVLLAVTGLLPAAPGDYTFYLSASWVEKEEAPLPRAWIGEVKVMAHDETEPYISDGAPEKMRYAAGAKARYRLSVVNPRNAGFRGMLRLHESYGLQHRRLVGTERCVLAPGERGTVDFTWRTPKVEAGRALEVELVEGDVVLDRWEDEMGVAENPGFLANRTMYTEEQGHMGVHHAFYIGPAPDTRSRQSVDYVIDKRRQRMEYFSWSYNELAQFIPPAGEDPFLGNEGIWWQSMKKLRLQFGLLTDAGVSTITYVNGHAWGPTAYDLYQRRPEWFVYGEDGDLRGNSWEMQWRSQYEHRYDLDFRIPRKSPFFYGVLNPLLPETRRYMADQFIRLNRELQFSGARWDVWSMDVTPNDYDLYGRPLAGDWEEADRLWAESLAAIKKLVAEEVKSFTWGYNYCAPEENLRTPLVLREKCRGGGWMLDERAYGYFQKNSPYHRWEDYRDRMVGWGNEILSYGGIYNPFAFRRGGALYGVDRLYQDIIRILSSGRDSSFYSNRAGLAGELDRLAFRFSNTYYGWNLRLQSPEQTEIAVMADAPLWWKELVFANTSHDGRPQRIVHLVNPPLAESIEDDPGSAVRPPVEGIRVSCAALQGKLPVKGWLLAAEPMDADAEPLVQAVPLVLRRTEQRVEVDVPLLHYFKTVVFEY